MLPTYISGNALAKTVPVLSGPKVGNVPRCWSLLGRNYTSNKDKMGIVVMGSLQDSMVQHSINGAR